MFILLNNHFSYRLSNILVSAYGTVNHVKDYHLGTASDQEIWRFAGQQNGVIISKDMDFYHLLNRYGPPPKLIWIRIGNATTQQIADLLINQSVKVQNFLSDASLSLLQLY